MSSILVQGAPHLHFFGHIVCTDSNGGGGGGRGRLFGHFSCSSSVVLVAPKEASLLGSACKSKRWAAATNEPALTKLITVV